MFQHTAARRRLAKRREADDSPDSFNTQPPEGGWEHNYGFVAVGGVSTHSRPKAAGHNSRNGCGHDDVSTHSRPKAAGADARLFCAFGQVSTHSRPKAAGLQSAPLNEIVPVSTHSRPKAAGLCNESIRLSGQRFNTQPPEGGWG